MEENSVTKSPVMTSFKYSVLAVFLFIPTLSLAQDASDSLIYTYDHKFDVAIGGSVEFTTPQKYGAAINLTFGKNTTQIISSKEIPPRTNVELKGINFETGIYRGGHRFGLYYINVNSSMIGAAGTRIGVVYLMNNSFSTVLEGKNLLGIEAELYAFYKIKVGVLKSIDENKFIPSLGFGIGIGPNLY